MPHSQKKPWKKPVVTACQSIEEARRNLSSPLTREQLAALKRIFDEGERVQKARELQWQGERRRRSA